MTNAKPQEPQPPQFIAFPLWLVNEVFAAIDNHVPRLAGNMLVDKLNAFGAPVQRVDDRLPPAQPAESEKK